MKNQQVKLYNTLTRSIEPVQPISDNKLSLYTCGLTVYSHPHIGNWVAYIYWDVLVRTLLAHNYDVTRVQNITDVGHLVSDEDTGEDKMEKGARSEGISAWDIAEKYISVANHEAYTLLDLLKPDHMPRATDFIQQQIDFVELLEKKGFTYTIKNDGVYFDTSKLKDYGKLARLDVEGLLAGARVQNDNKRNVTDFAVWKFSPVGKQRDMEWDSPWGVGFPGWHLECSVMARELLGDEIDIHTGGIDHIPVHHTNEIAQTEAITGQRFAKTWLHNNHLKIDGGKMAKSLENTYTLQDITDKGYEIDAFKLLVLSSHYQTEGNFTWEILDAAQNRLNHYKSLADLAFQPKPVKPWLTRANVVSKLKARLADNLNTPEALALLSELSSQASDRLISGEEIKLLRATLASIDKLLGLHLSERKDITPTQKKLLAKRQAARDTKQWHESDAIRDKLAKQQIIVQDTDFGQIWTRLA